MPVIALLVDADHWPPTSLHAVVAAVRRRATPGRAVLVGFGRLRRGPYAAWMGHYDRHGFELVEIDVPQKNAADTQLVERARALTHAASVDEIWIASKDKPLLTKVAAAVAGRAAVRVVEDPEARALPPGVEWIPVAPAREPVPPNLLERLRAAVAAAGGRPPGAAQLSAITTLLADLEPRDFGRESLRDLLRDLPDDFELRESAAGGAVTVSMRR